MCVVHLSLGSALRSDVASSFAMRFDNPLCSVWVLLGQVLKTSGVHAQLYFPEDGEQYWFPKRKVVEWLRTFPQPVKQPNANSPPPPPPPQPAAKKPKKESTSASAMAKPAGVAAKKPPPTAAPPLHRPPAHNPYDDDLDDFIIEEFSSAEELHAATLAKPLAATLAKPLAAAPPRAPPPPSAPPSAPSSVIGAGSPSAGSRMAMRGGSLGGRGGRGRAGGRGLGEPSFDTCMDSLGTDGAPRTCVTLGSMPPTIGLNDAHAAGCHLPGVPPH